MNTLHAGAMRPVLAALASAILSTHFAMSAALAMAPRDGLVGHGGPVRALALLTDARTLVSGGFDSAIIVWDTEAGTARRVLRLHDSTVTALAALPGGCFASGGEDARIAIWCGDGPTPARLLSGHSGPVSALAVSADGRWLASASWDRTVRLWPVDDRDGTPRVAGAHNAPVNGVAFVAGEDAIVSAGYDGLVRLSYLDAARSPLQTQLLAAANGVAATRDGEIVVTGADGRLRFLDTRLAITAEIELPDGPLTAVTVSPNGRTVATAGLRTPVTLIERSTGRRTTQILGPGLPIWVLRFSADGSQLFTGGVDRAVRRWDAATGKPAGDVISQPAAEPAEAGGTERGAQVFRACRACHGLTVEDGNRAGPTLHGVFGRRIASAPGYVYSEALRRMDLVWTPETIARLFEIGPNAYTPGTKMPEQRITDPADRQALVEWLRRAAKP